MYIVIDKTSVAGLWLKLENLYMMKSLSNSSHGFYSLCMKEGTPILEHMNTLDKIVSDLL